MSRRDPTVPLKHMRDYAQIAIDLAEQRERADLDEDVTFRLALIRALEVVGEAATRVPEAMRDRHSGVPWRQVVGLRNILIHAYDDVDLDIIWTIVSEELELLIHELERVLRLEGEP